MKYPQTNYWKTFAGVNGNSEGLTVDHLDFKMTEWFKNIHDRRIAWEEAKQRHADVVNDNPIFPTYGK